jgi:hypothetical protein
MKSKVFASFLPLYLAGIALSFTTAPDNARAGGVYGPDTCKQGYVWRDSFPGDHVCVRPGVRTQAAHDNQQATYRVNPYGGSYGSDTCRNGYVWREAFPGDHACVTPATRSQAASDNKRAPHRYQP